MIFTTKLISPDNVIIETPPLCDREGVNYFWTRVWDNDLLTERRPDGTQIIHNALAMQIMQGKTQLLYDSQTGANGISSWNYYLLQQWPYYEKEADFYHDNFLCVNHNGIIGLMVPSNDGEPFWSLYDFTDIKDIYVGEHKGEPALVIHFKSGDCQVLDPTTERMREANDYIPPKYATNRVTRHLPELARRDPRKIDLYDVDSFIDPEFNMDYDHPEPDPPEDRYNSHDPMDNSTNWREFNVEDDLRRRYYVDGDGATAGFREYSHQSFNPDDIFDSSF